MEAAAADFTRGRFLGSKEKAAEPEKAGGTGARPVEIDPLEPRPADFDGFIFPGKVQFDKATFYGDASFQGATFEGDAWFRDATFKGDAWFKSANFNGGAVFDHAVFKGEASFRSAAFTGHAWFDSVCFHGAASFYTVTAKHGFALLRTRFKRRVPDFLSAKFDEPVMFDNIRLEGGVEPGGWFRSIFGGFFVWLFGRLDPALSAKYRALKRLAIQSDDHRIEQYFFRGELRARRYGEDKPWHPGFWVGILYEALSGFGNSILLPLLWLFGLCLLSGWFYLGQSVTPDVSPRAQFRRSFCPICRIAFTRRSLPCGPKRFPGSPARTAAQPIRPPPRSCSRSRKARCLRASIPRRRALTFTPAFTAAMTRPRRQMCQITLCYGAYGRRLGARRCCSCSCSRCATGTRSSSSQYTVPGWRVRRALLAGS